MTKLDRVWKNCLRMWKDIAKDWDGEDAIVDCKIDWLNRHRFKRKVFASCFFCDWAVKHGQEAFEPYWGCEMCPGALVDPSFKCGHPRYYYSEKPKAFYQKLVQLDKKRRGTT